MRIENVQWLFCSSKQELNRGIKNDDISTFYEVDFFRLICFFTNPKQYYINLRLLFNLLFKYAYS